MTDDPRATSQFTLDFTLAPEVAREVQLRIEPVGTKRTGPVDGTNEHASTRRFLVFDIDTGEQVGALHDCGVMCSWYASDTGGRADSRQLALDTLKIHLTHQRTR